MSNHQKYPKIAVVIPFYKGENYIEACLDSILGSSHLPERILIVDNGGDGFLLPKKYQNKKIEVIPTQARIGFGRACNVGVYHSLEQGDDFAIILNQDAVMDMDCVKQLVIPFQKDNQIFATVPISYKYDFSGIYGAVYDGYIRPITEYVNDKEKGGIKEYYFVNNQQLNGACVAFRLDMVKEIGLFDPLIFLYGEEVELFRRAELKHQFRLALVPEAKIGHEHQHAIATEEKKRQIHLWMRHSKQIYLLKTPDKSFGFCCLKVLKYTIHSYLQAVLKFDFSLLSKYLSSDWEYLKLFNSIRKNRDKEIFLRQIELSIKKDKI